MTNVTTVPNGTVLCNSTTIAAEDLLLVQTDTTLDLIGIITNFGTIELDGGNGYNAYLQSDGPYTALVGGGIVLLVGSDGPGGGAIETGVLTNIDNTLEGGGIIENLINDVGGIINANLNGQALGVGYLTNMGLLEATDGGILAIVGSIDNSGGSILADNAVVQLSSVEISGGTLLTTNNGTFEMESFLSMFGELNDVTIAPGSDFLVPWQSGIALFGTITNEGTISILGGEVGAGDNATLTGKGLVILGASSGGSAFLQASLINLDNIIEGSGYVELSTNESGGVIDGNVQGQTLTIGSLSNLGLLEATSAGTLLLYVINNIGGSIAADGGNLILSDINGGTLSGTDNSVISFYTTSRINNVTILSGSKLNIQGGGDISGKLTNVGTFSLTGGGGLSGYDYGATLDGGGTVILAGSGSNGGTALYGFTNADNTIEGSGVLSGLENSAYGAIEADLQGQILDVNGITNAGRLEATDGGILALNSAIEDYGDIIFASAGTVELNGGEIDGGTISATDGGVFEVINSALLNDVTIAAGTTLVVTDGSALTIANSVTNLGEISVAGGGSVSAYGSQTLEGTGIVVLSTSTDGGGSVSGSLINLGNTIEGTGTIYAITNGAGGTIDANVAGQTISVSDIANSGLLEATDGGILYLENTIQNAGGTIAAVGGTVVVSTSIKNGTLGTSEGGVLAAANGANFNNVTISPGSTLAIYNEPQGPEISGTLTNTGTIWLTGDGGLSSYGATLAGGGVVVLDSNAGIVLEGFTNADNTIEGFFREIGNLTNDASGTIDANVAGKTITIAGDLVNAGTVEANNGGVLAIIAGADIENDGGTIIAAGGTVELDDSGEISGGTLSATGGGVFEATPSFFYDGSRLDDVTIAAGSTFTIPDSATLNIVDSLTNLGEILVAGGGSVYEYYGSETLEGTGIVVLGTSTGGGSVSGPLTNLGNTIEGFGTIYGMTNGAGGTIDANVAGQTISVSDIANSGLLEATDGGILYLENTIQNAGGTIAAAGGTVVVSTSIKNGTLGTSEGGVLAAANGANFNNVTISPGSTLAIYNEPQGPEISGTLTNTGTIWLTGDGGLSSYGATLAGGGVVVLDSNAGIVLEGFTNADNTIEGFFREIGNLTNDASGTIDANVAGKTITIAGDLVNAGTVEANNGGVLAIIAGADIENDGGTIIAAGGTVELDDSGEISGGTLSATGGGVFEATPSFFYDGSRLDDVTIAAGSTFTIPDSATLNIVDSLTNLGEILVAGGGSVYEYYGSETLEGTGIVVLGTSTGGGSVSGPLTNLGNTIEGFGTIYGMTNGAGGTIDANVAGQTISASDIANSGLLEATDGGILYLENTIQNAGGTIAAAGGTVVVSTNVVGGTLSISDGGVLAIDNGASDTGVISRLGVGDTIEWLGETVADATIIGTTLTADLVGGGTETLEVAPGLSALRFSVETGQDGLADAVKVDEAACYCPGTRIATDRGDIPIERLAIGDRVLTLAGKYRPIRWIGHRAYAAPFTRNNKSLWPVRIAAGALAENLPRNDLLVSPNHALFLDGVLIEAACLVNGASILITPPNDTVEYFNIEFDSHDVVLAEGVPAETFLDRDCRGMFQNAREYHALYSDAVPDPAPVFHARRVIDGATLAAVKARIDARAGLDNADPADPGRLGGWLDRADCRGVAGWAIDADHFGAPVALEVQVDGVAVARLVANRFRADLASVGDNSGRCSFDLRWDRPLDASVNHVVTVRRLCDGAPLPGAPVILPALTPLSALEPFLDQAVADVIAKSDAAALDDALAILMDGIDALLTAEADAAGERETRASRFRLEADVERLHVA